MAIRRKNRLKAILTLAFVLTSAEVFLQPSNEINVGENMAQPQVYEPDGFIITHFSGSGFNNQVQQVLNGIALAISLKRTYCLPSFVRRKSDEVNSVAKLIEFPHIFDTRHLQNYVQIESITNCSSLCNRRIDSIINMSPNEITRESYERQNTMKLMGFDGEFNELRRSNIIEKLRPGWLAWASKSEVVSDLELNNKRCIELFQPFPAAKIVVDGSMAMLHASLQFVNTINDKAARIAYELFGNRVFISVHLRYEYQVKGESKCRKKNLPMKGEGDTCFVIFLKKQRSTLKDYLNLGWCYDCEKYLLFVHLEDLGRALSKFQAVASVKDVYLASDADFKVIQKLKRYVDLKTFSDSELGLRMLQSANMEVVSAVEQALCVQGKHFIGTSYSTWTTTVWLLRKQKHEEQEGIDGFIEHLTAPFPGGSTSLKGE